MASVPEEAQLTEHPKPTLFPDGAAVQPVVNASSETVNLNQSTETIVRIRGESLDHEDLESLNEVIVIKDHAASNQLPPGILAGADLPEESTNINKDHVAVTSIESQDNAEQSNSTDANIPFIPENLASQTDLSTTPVLHANEIDKGREADNVPWMHYIKSVEDVTFDDLWVESGMDASDVYNSDVEEYQNFNENTNKDKSNDKLVTVYDAIGQLDDTSSILNINDAIPRLNESEQQNVERKYIEELKLSLAEDDIREYLDEFEDEVQNEILMVGSIALEDVQDEEKKLREDHIAFQEQLVKQQKQRQEEIIAAMEKAKSNVMKRFNEKQRLIRMREDHMMQKDRLIQDKIHRAFKRSEDQLIKALNKRKGEVKTMYGDLTFADGQYGGSRGRRWKVDWNKTPQPIQVKLKCLRGVKDKLPRSRYVVMVSLYDRLGGHVMKWSNLRGQQWGGATLPIGHDGEFYNIEMEIDQSVFTVCPSQPAMRPGMILVFELFILRGTITPTDRVVAWGCFPICDGEFNVINGKYKCPLLRGNMDPSIDKFETIENLIANDLDHWLSNLYFEIVKLPRYMSGQREFEVELQFSANLVNFPNRLDEEEDVNSDGLVDGQKPLLGSHSDLGSSRFSLQSSRQSTSTDEKIPGPSNGVVAHGRTSPNKSLQVPEKSELRKRRSSKASTHSASNARPCTVLGSRKMIEKSDDIDSDSDYSDDDVHGIANDVGFHPVKGQPGLFSKLYHSNPADVYARKSCTIVPKTPLLGSSRRRRVLTHVEQLEQHTYHIKSESSRKGHLPRRARHKTQYIRRMLLSELGLSQIKSREFWAVILVLLLTWWIRLYLHYFGQWIFLQAIFIPINKFDLLPYTVNLNYQNTLLRSREEIAMIVIGPFTNLIVLILMLLLAWFIRSLFGRFSNILSRFIMAFGINTLLDPIWIAIVDSALMRFEFAGGDAPIGDAFKLYWHFDRYYNNDNVSFFVSTSITVFLYAVTMFTCATVLYMYFLKLHNNARLMDVYWRLHGKETDIFIPLDLELTNKELNYICRKAEQWRGKEGERRKTTVYDYRWQEDGDNVNVSKADGKEVTTHVAIFSIHLDGLRELYRQFLRMPNGTLVEVFGDFSLPGIDDRIRESVREKTQQGHRFSSHSHHDIRRQSQISSTTSLNYHLNVPYEYNV